MLARGIRIADGRKIGEGASLLHHRFAPAFRQANRGGGDPLVAQYQAAMRAGTNARIIAITPIDQVMAALRSGPGVIGDFISRHSRRFAQLLRGFVKSRRQIVVGNAKLAVLVEQREGRLRLDGELIEREMIGAEGERLFQFGAPLRVALTRPRIDQIQRDAIEIPHRQIERRFRFFGIVQPPQEFQIGIVQRLHPQRQAIDAGGAVIGKSRRFRAGGIGLERDLDMVCHPPEA